MKKRIWIMNHYATNQLFNQGGRHYWFAKYLERAGYESVVFSCNVWHNSEGNYFKGDQLWQEKQAPDGFPFVVIRSTPYAGNGLSRMKNMAVFAVNLARTAKQYAKLHGKPDIILASSVHPLTVLAGDYIARRMKVPYISEVRDLWPESIFAYYPEKKKEFYSKLLYACEKRMYKKADSIIFTMEGGQDYIIEKGWDRDHGGPVYLAKVHHINNGVDLEAFEESWKSYPYHDPELEDSSVFKVVYTGSVRRANNLDLVLSAAKLLSDTNVRFLIWGDGIEKERLIKRCSEEGILNVRFKGSVERKFIPSILKKSEVNFFVLEESDLYRFGLSLNKSFEYLASSKPLLIIGRAGHSMVEKYQCGVHVQSTDPAAFAKAVLCIKEQSAKEYANMCKNAQRAAYDYDFKVLSRKLMDVIEGVRP